ncbi:MAG TPA: CocE/NonD family hydrolase [Micromonosporaceae bacterium]|jgi:hypothetical protein
MTLASRAIGRSFKLPPAATRAVAVDRDVDVRMRDGVVLKTNHYAPRLDSAPTVMIRSPYGRNGIIGVATGRVLAERGFHVVLQSCRGTFGSGGDFQPMRHERTDGLDTIAWIQEQPWFDGNLFTYGPSYVGFTQWAVADSPAIKGMLLAVTASSFRDPTYAGGSFSLDTVLNWAGLIGDQGGSLLSFAVRQARTRRRLRGAWNHLPLSEVDVVATRREVQFVREWLANADDEAYWLDRGHAALIGSITAPICMVGGWYDIFLPWQLADYDRLRAAGAQPRLVIGAWTHASTDLLAQSIREGIDWFREQLSGESTEKPVKLYVGGANEWRTYDEWPPAARTQEWFLGPDRTLSTIPTAAAGSDHFRYDPADPTPSPGGPLLTQEAGRVDNAGVETRADMLVYTSDVLSDDVEAIGPVTADIHLRTSSPHFDVFVRICDVAPNGRSENVCDGLTRIDDGAETVRVELWPTAYRWRAGHRIRVQVAGAAHPRYARNTGTGEPLGKATTLQSVDYEIALGASTINLPVPI